MHTYQVDFSTLKELEQFCELIAKYRKAKSAAEASRLALVITQIVSEAASK